MKKQQSFAPSEYIKAVKKGRKQLLRKSLIGVSGMAMLFIGIMSTTGYADYFVTQSAAAKGYEVAGATTLPSHQSYTLPTVPDKQDNLNGDFEEAYIDEESYYDYGDDDTFSDLGCNVLGISISGDLGTKEGDSTADYIRDTLDAYKANEDVLAILVEVDSGGGSPVAGDEVKDLLLDQSVPVVAQIREIGASAAYLSILSADRIFAHRYGSVGSIGVIYPYFDYSGKNEKDGIKYDPIKTGLFKDSGTSERPITAEERQIIQDELNFIYEGFISDVALYRGLTIDQVRVLADGKTWLANKALELGLIDEVGGSPEVSAYLRETIGEEPVVCWQ